MKSKLKNPIVQQYALEIALPLLGYFFFGWSIAVIIAFYFMDYLASEVVRHRRHYKIMKHDKHANNLMFYVAICISVLFYGVSLFWAIINCAIFSEGQEFNYLHEIQVFIREEGWFLLPIVYLAYHIKDVMTFYMPRKYLKHDFNKSIKYYILESLVMFGLIMIGLYCWVQFNINDIPALFTFIGVKLIFDLGFVRMLNLKTFNQ